MAKVMVLEILEKHKDKQNCLNLYNALQVKEADLDWLLVLIRFLPLETIN